MIFFCRIRCFAIFFGFRKAKKIYLSIITGWDTVANFRQGTQCNIHFYCFIFLGNGMEKSITVLTSKVVNIHLWVRFLSYCLALNVMNICLKVRFLCYCLTLKVLNICLMVDGKIFVLLLNFECVVEAYNFQVKSQFNTSTTTDS